MNNHQLLKSGLSGLFRKSLLLFIFCSTGFLYAQEKPLDQLITEKDASFWKAYNACDIAGMEIFLAEDLEFYHDKGGITNGREALSNGLRKGLCSTGKNHLRREAVPGSVSIFPLRNKDSVYGAIITGEHLFYIVDDESEKLDGQAKFSHLWLNKNGEWKMHRVFSFDHGPAVYNNLKQPITLTEEKLKEFTGQYLTASNDPIKVDLIRGHLELQALGKTFILLPENEHSFFTEDRDLTFTFSKKAPRKLTIFESDNKVEEAMLHQK